MNRHDMVLVRKLLWKFSQKYNTGNFIMNTDKFKRVYDAVKSQIKAPESYTHAEQSEMRKKVLAATLRYLASSDPLHIIQLEGRMTRTLLENNLPIVLEAMCKSMQQHFIKPPYTPKQWETTQRDFISLWQFPRTFASVSAQVFRTQNTHVAFLVAVNAWGKIIYLNVGKTVPRTKPVFLRDIGLGRLLTEALTNEGQMAITPSDSYFLYGNEMGTHSVYKTFPLGQMVTEDRFKFHHAHPDGYRLPVNRALDCLINKFPRLIDALSRTEKNMAHRIVKACCILYNMYPPPISVAPPRSFPSPYPDTIVPVDIDFLPQPQEDGAWLAVYKPAERKNVDPKII